MEREFVIYTEDIRVVEQFHEAMKKGVEEYLQRQHTYSNIEKLTNDDIYNMI